MQTDKAVRFLLLRHLERVRKHLAEQQRTEIARSLRVTAEESEFVVCWNLDGHSHRMTFPKDAFELYFRADLSPSGPSASHSVNELAGRQFIRKVVGAEVVPELARRGRAGWSRESSVLMAGLAAAAVIHSGRARADFLVLALINLLDALGPLARVLAGPTWMALAAFGLPLAATYGSAAFAGLQWLDPVGRWRWQRVGGAVAGFLAVGLIHVNTMTIAWPSLPTAAVVMAAIAFSVFRSMLGVHRTSLHLVLPVVAAGAWLEGESRLAITLAGLVAIDFATASLGGRWSSASQSAAGHSPNESGFREGRKGTAAR